jgi:hypothetical protein
LQTAGYLVNRHDRPRYVGFPTIPELCNRKNVPSLPRTIDLGRKGLHSHLHRYPKAGLLSGMACLRNTTSFSCQLELRNGTPLPTLPLLALHHKLPPKQDWSIRMERLISSLISLRTRMVVRVSDILMGRWNHIRRIEVSRAILGLVYSMSGVRRSDMLIECTIAICDESALGRRKETE